MSTTPPFPPRISRFIRQHHVLTLCTTSDQGSWCAHVFYTWMPEENALVFTTGTDTRHGREMLANPHVSGGIVLETKVVGRIRGVQVSGMAYSVGDYETVGEKDYETVGLKDYETVGLKDYETVSKSKSLKVSKSSAKTAYLKKFPFAIAAKLDLWVLHLEYVKMTDNRLGFGRKIEWRRGAESE